MTLFEDNLGEFLALYHWLNDVKEILALAIQKACIEHVEGRLKLWSFCYLDDGIENCHAEKRHDRRKQLRMCVMTLWQKIGSSNVQKATADGSNYRAERRWRDPDDERRKHAKNWRDSINK